MILLVLLLLLYQSHETLHRHVKLIMHNSTWYYVGTHSYFYTGITPVNKFFYIIVIFSISMILHIFDGSIKSNCWSTVGCTSQIVAGYNEPLIMEFRPHIWNIPHFWYQINSSVEEIWGLLITLNLKSISGDLGKCWCRQFTVIPQQLATYCTFLSTLGHTFIRSPEMQKRKNITAHEQDNGKLPDHRDCAQMVPFSAFRLCSGSNEWTHSDSQQENSDAFRPEGNTLLPSRSPRASRRFLMPHNRKHPFSIL